MYKRRLLDVGRRLGLRRKVLETKPTKIYIHLYLFWLLYYIRLCIIVLDRHWSSGRSSHDCAQYLDRICDIQGAHPIRSSTASAIGSSCAQWEASIGSIRGSK